MPKFPLKRTMIDGKLINFDMQETILIFLSGSGVLGLILYGAIRGTIWLAKQSTEKLLEKALEDHRSKLSKELESYKRELDLKYEHALSLQDRRHKLFEEFSGLLEDIFKFETKNDELSHKLNKVFGLLALYAPDDVYISLKTSLEGMVRPEKVKPIVYFALRKSLFGALTKLTEDDLVKHIKAEHKDIKATCS